MSKPKLLFLCTSPLSDGSGASLRTFNLARILARFTDLSLAVATGRPWTDEQWAFAEGQFRIVDRFRYETAPIGGPRNRLRQIFDPRFLNTNGVCVPIADRPRLEQLIEGHGAVWIHTQKVANAFRRYAWPHSVIDVDDYPSRFHASALAQAPWVLPKLRRLRNAFAWRRREAVWRERFSALTVCKDADVAHFGGGPRVHVVPNGFNVPPSATPRLPVAEARCLGMIGDFTYLPNLDGVTWFARECWPAIRAAHPQATLRLVGKDSAGLAQRLAAPGILGLGYVPDTGPEIASWSAMIVPTRLGGGTHLKVAEGLARKVPIVTTSHGARGYDLEHGRHALIVSEPAAFSRACLSLLQHEDIRRQLSEEGWRLFTEKYSWDAIQPAVERTIEACLSFRR